MNKEHYILILAWVLFYGFHSLLASEWAKSMGSRAGIKGKNYRIFYNLFSALTLAIALYISVITPSIQVIPKMAWMKTLGLILAVWGVWIVNLTFRYYDFRTFIGLKDEEKTALKKTGLMKLVRHPIYVGTLFILIGYFLFSPTDTSLIILLVSTAYILIGIQLEERKLIREFGDEYVQYKKEVPMLIPFLKF